MRATVPLADRTSGTQGRLATLTDVAGMAQAHPDARFELVGGRVEVMPPPDMQHAVITTRLVCWLVAGGFPADRVIAAGGLALTGYSGRCPDVMLLRRPVDGGLVWADPQDVAVVVEVVSPGSRQLDLSTKLIEYGRVRIPQYWIVTRGAPDDPTPHGPFVHRHSGWWARNGGMYRRCETTPLAELLSLDPLPLT